VVGFLVRLSVVCLTWRCAGSAGPRAPGVVTTASALRRTRTRCPARASRAVPRAIAAGHGLACFGDFTRALAADAGWG
jgi:hypothetical protein